MTKATGATPAGRRTSLFVRMLNAARDAGVIARRIHLVVAIDRLLARLLEVAAPGQWVVKGGYANQLRRPNEARFTEDLDLKIDAAIETAPELLASGLRSILATTSATTSQPPRHPWRAPPAAASGSSSSHGSRAPSSSASRSMSVPRTSSSANSSLIYPTQSSSGSASDGRGFPVYPINQHFAEKLHALTLPRDVENTRARDLIDLVWFVRRFTFRSDALAIACTATFERRATHSWPPVIDLPPDSWTRPYGVWRAELDLAEPTPAAAASALRSFLEPVYFGVAGRSWDPAAREWRVGGR